MAESGNHVIVFHGTTSIFDDGILSNGFLSKPQQKLSERMSVSLNVEKDHMVSFDGTYVALERDTSAYYAKSAAEVFGGQPRIYALRVPLSSLVPDEDEVHFALSCHLAAALGFDECADDYDGQKSNQSWSLEIARDVIQGMAESFSMDESSVEHAAQHLHAMIEPSVTHWDGDLFFFHPEGNDQGWASPNWVRRLTSLEGGYDLYRRRMDQLLGCMKGAAPESCPAGFTAFKGRIRDDFKFDDNENGVTIIGYGNIDDPFEDYSNLESVDGTEIALEPEAIRPISLKA